jgi:hypothetical protein
LEGLNYSNYIFSTLHIHIGGVFKISMYSGFLYIIIGLLKIFEDFGLRGYKFPRISLEDLESRMYKSVKKSGIKRLLFFQLLAVVLVVYINANFPKSLNFFWESSVDMLRNSNRTYSEKMKKSWGIYYDYMIFVQKLTPNDSVILIPPMRDCWLREGNPFVSWYFLYPRKLVGSKEQNLNLAGIDYIMITEGSWEDNKPCQMWPNDTLNGEVWYMDVKNGEPMKQEQHYYDPNTAIADQRWGLIKLDK